MKNASLLILVAGTAVPQDIEPLLRTAAQHQMYLSFLVLGPLPQPPLYAYGVEPYGMPSVPENWQTQIEEGRAKLKVIAVAIENQLAASGASGDVDIVGCEPSALPSVIAKHAGTCDGVVILDGMRSDAVVFRHAVHGALFQSPVGVMLNPVRSGPSLHPARVFVAWDTSLPAARAVHAALPMLKEAAEVTVGVFDPVASEYSDGENPGSDVARYLSHHGCHVDLRQYPSGGEEIGTCIRKHAVEAGSELIVMGAYGHSRMRQAVFGGTTRSMIEQTDMSVMLTH